jgi:hypothetical protein
MPGAAPFGPFTVNLSPDCEMVIIGSSGAARDWAQCRDASWLASTFKFQTPSTEIGAVRLRPLLRIPISPMRGSTTRKKYASKNLFVVVDIVFSNTELSNL